MKWKNMITGIMLAGALGLTITGCASKDTATDTTGKENTEADGAGNETASDDILSKLEAANDFDQMLENYERFGYILNYTAADGTQDSYYIYKDKDRYAQEGENNVEIDDKGDIYGYNDDEKTCYRVLFVGDSYGDYVYDSQMNNTFIYTESEHIESQNEKDGIVVLETKEEAEVDSDTYEAYGYSKEDVDYIKVVYEIDSTTNIILSMKQYVVGNDKETLYYELTLQPDCEEYQVDAQITEGVFGEDVRNITIVTDPGTEKEAAFSQTVTKGSMILMVPSAEYDNILYSDKECTMVQKTVSKEEDQTLYMKSGK